MVIGAKNLKACRRYVTTTANTYQQKKALRQHGRGFFNFWGQGSFEGSWLWRFLDRPRLRSLATGRRIAFVSVFGHPRILERIKAEYRIFYTGENLDFYPAYGDHLFDSVDLSLGFDHLQRPDYLRLPIWLLECFEADMQLADIVKRLKQQEKNRLDLLDRPANVASLLASHDSVGVRGQIADIFTKYGEVKYGGSFRNNGLIVPPGWNKKHQFIRRYPFQICPENSSRDGYVTEKLFQAIAAGCVPIYWGPGTPVEPTILNSEAIITFKPSQPHLFEKQVQNLLRDTSQLRQFRDTPPFQPSAAENIYSYYLNLEDRLIAMLT